MNFEKCPLEGARSTYATANSQAGFAHAHGILSTMGTTAFTSLFKPDLATMGYGLFLAVNAASVWGGVFPFIPLEFQTPDIIFWFFLAQASVYSVSYFASAVG